MATIEERENILPLEKPRESGFSPRYAERQASRSRSRTFVDLECQHVLRSEMTQSSHGRPPIQYRLWMEAAKLQPPAPPEKPDVIANSMIWRNFRRQYSEFIMSDKTSDVGQQTEPCRTCDPATCSCTTTGSSMTVPVASSVGDFTLDKFVSASPRIADPMSRDAVLRSVDRDLEELQRLRLRSELRQPPVTHDGRIAPPRNFRRYSYYKTTPIAESPNMIQKCSDAPTQIPADTITSQGHVDVFGRYVPRARQPTGYQKHVWKLEYRRNNPEYMQVVTTRGTSGVSQQSAVNKQTLRFLPGLGVPNNSRA